MSLDGTYSCDGDDESINNRTNNNNIATTPSIVNTSSSTSNDVTIRRSTKGTNNNDTDAANENSSIQLVAKGTAKEVYQAKLIVLIVVIISTIGAILIYFYTRNAEYIVFHKQYKDDSEKVLASLLNAMDRSLGAFESLSTTFVTIAESSNQTFPFVTIPKYAAHIGKSMQLTGALITSLAPVVPYELRAQWELYASSNNTNIQKAMNETLSFQHNFSHYYGRMPDQYNWSFIDFVYDDNFHPVSYIKTDQYQPDRRNIMIPNWQDFPLCMKVYAPANYDWYSMYDSQLITAAMAKKEALLAPPVLIEKPDDPDVTEANEAWCEYLKDYLPQDENCFEPLAIWMYPVLDQITSISVTESPQYPDGYDTKAFLVSLVYWRHLLKDILPESSSGIVIVFENSYRGDIFTYQINGPKTKYLGGGDRHDPKYDHMVLITDLYDLEAFRSQKPSYFGVPMYNTNNTYTLYVYPSDEMKAHYVTDKPMIFAVSAVVFIVIPFLVFILYDFRVSRRNDEIISSAKRSNAIVSSLFPSHIRDQLITQSTAKTSKHSESGLFFSSAPPIAELYPETTVLFADIVNFTAWCSVRNPSQVFTLLESLYSAFDWIANKRQVFKVETIGDSYVAVTGLPAPRLDHASVMCRYARDIVRTMKKVVTELGTQLGPGTSTLQIRVGLNSGPTTAGVLRGAKGRFQLFGDTVNTAARMESNSLPGRIMCSQKTADALRALGKEDWITKRSDLLNAKGKGMMQCYWVNPTSSKRYGDHYEYDAVESQDQLESQIIVWIADLLIGLLKIVINSRQPSTNDLNKTIFKVDACINSATPRDEVTETIVLPKSDTRQNNQSVTNTELSNEVKYQVQQYVAAIAASYHKNQFHNFNHASHVIMTTTKLLNRIIKPTEQAHSATAYGITSDPLTQFAIVFSALIHDADHPGVSNAQLVKEEAAVAKRFDNKSVAEQNSITLAWDILMQKEYTAFREAIMADESDYRRFRQLIVNSVIATDLFDKDMKSLRDTRWSKVFGNNDVGSSDSVDEQDYNRRATIIIEYIIQASDVSHTMQHWHIYQEWNRRLFNEMYFAYKSGRDEKDPSDAWYNGELWFFDNYIIPLAKKLKTCGVFGVSCDELLDYASDNRNEWAMKGQAIVEENIRLAKEMFPSIQANCNTIDTTKNS